MSSRKDCRLGVTQRREVGMKDAVKVLAEFFTGPEVVHSSVGLQVGGVRARRAANFFEARSALGIRGNMDAGEAESAIISALCCERRVWRDGALHCCGPERDR